MYKNEKNEKILCEKTVKIHSQNAKNAPETLQKDKKLL